MAFTLLWAVGALHQFRREARLTQEREEEALALATEHGFDLVIVEAMNLRGWALAEQGQVDEGIGQMCQSLADRRAQGTEHFRSINLCRLAETYAKSGQSEAGLAVIAEALAFVEQTDERFFEAELYRFKGELLIQQIDPDTQQAETCYHHALAIAHRQQAKSLELRAATSLARLWQIQGKRQEAYELLTSVYGWFTEGFDTADLIDAKALLVELEEGR